VIRSVHTQLDDPDDPRDVNDDGRISGQDVSAAISECSRRGCRPVAR